MPKLTEELRLQSLDIAHLKDLNEELRHLSVLNQHRCSLAGDEIKRLATQINETSGYFCNNRQRGFGGGGAGGYVGWLGLFWGVLCVMSAIDGFVMASALFKIGREGA